jgi:predicted GIY-YIG superfamily endonuclease
VFNQIRLTMDSSLNIVNLIENTSIEKLSAHYNNKLLNKIKDTFTESQQQLFVSSFYCYLNYHPTNDFVIDLDNIWVWLGFSTKQKAKMLLEKQFIVDKDYKNLLNQQDKQDNGKHGGHNKETFLLNIKTFKLFCIKAGTEKANEIHEYFVKLEYLLHEVVQEECEEFKLQLENQIVSSQLEKELLKEKTILEQFTINDQCVYYGLIDNKSETGEKLIKFGNSNNLNQRVEMHKKKYTNFRLANAFRVENKTLIENAMKQHSELKKYRRSIKINQVNCTELLAIDNLSFEKLESIIKEIIEKIEYSPEKYVKLLNENNKLKEENARLMRESSEKFLLNENKKLRKIKEEYNEFMKTTFKQISKENLRIKHEYENLLKTINSTTQSSTENVSTDIVVNNEPITQRKRLKKFIKHTDGYFYIDGKKYQKLNGTRLEVWNNIAYRTTGNILRSGFILNSAGEIVSKIKSEFSTINLNPICQSKNKIITETNVNPESNV